LACVSPAEHELTGVRTYYALTPRDTREAPADALTQGWFTGMIPVTVPTAGSSFPDAARAAQVSFDRGVELAEVPYDRVVEVVPTLGKPRPNFPGNPAADNSVTWYPAALTSAFERVAESGHWRNVA
jgi:hypothetical protein